jgi:hypothetical protein
MRGRVGVLRSCEHTFLTPHGHPYTEFKRALERGNLWVAEAAAGDLPQVSLEDAYKLVCLYGEKESPKFEKAAMRWLDALGSPISEPAWRSKPKLVPRRDRAGTSASNAPCSDVSLRLSHRPPCPYAR